ncbi:MAG: hypothetical protein LBV02_07015 [Bacteroidales bacterium]|jgi:hypothetical protein|nr:hypothetical protein [Bacteroidales bacterium]
MKKWLSLLFLILALAGCNRNKTDYKAEIQGKWICHEINYLFIPSTEFFVMEFRNDNTQFHAQAYDSHLAVGAEWMENSNYTYTVDEDMISLQGTNPLGQSVDLSMKIKRVGFNYLDYQEIKTVIDGQDLTANRIFSLYKMNDIRVEKLVGQWEVFQVINNDSLVALKYKLDFKADKSFDVYYLENDNWEKYELRASSYFIHGDLLISDFIYPPYGESTCFHSCATVSSISNESINCSSLEKFPGSGNLLEKKYRLLRR